MNEAGYKAHPSHNAGEPYWYSLTRFVHVAKVMCCRFCEMFLDN